MSARGQVIRPRADPAKWAARLRHTAKALTMALHALEDFDALIACSGKMQFAMRMARPSPITPSSNQRRPPRAHAQRPYRAGRMPMSDRQP